MTLDPGGGPFGDLTVLELGQFVVVPFCATQLAHGGARVIKVEPVHGDAYRLGNLVAPKESRQFLTKNRGKESIALRIGDPETAPILDALIAAADVVLTNMSPAALARHGLDYEAVAAKNPRVVYGIVSAFGHAGPEAPLPGMDVVAQARSGLMQALGAERDGLPVHSEVQVADYSSSLLLLAGVTSALYVRERTGRGQKVEVSLLAGALAVQNNSLHHVYGVDEAWRDPFLHDDLPRLRAAGAAASDIEAVREAARPDKGIHRSTYRVMRTADGAVAVAGAGQARLRFLEVLGLRAEAATLDPDALTARVDEIIAGEPSAVWLARLRPVDVPVAEVRNVEELIFDEHVAAEGLMVDVEHPVVGRYRTLGALFGLSDTPLQADRPSPSFAADTRAVLADLGWSDEAIDDLAARGLIAVADRSVV
jgi:crotonobetainyl-CoA:carnitine CoA-transferase CaiB-like acyl-CoA transferase